MQPILDRHQKLAFLNCALVFTISGLVIIAYQFDMLKLENLFIGNQLSNPVTALFFLGSAVSLFCQVSELKQAHLIGKSIAFFIFFSALLRFTEIFLPYTSGIDRWLYPDKLMEYGSNGHPNFMATHTAFLFCLLGSSLFFYRFRINQKNLLCDLLAFTVTILSFFCIIEYLYNSTELYRVKSSIAMAFPTVISFFLLSTAILFKRSAFGFFSLFTRKYIGSKIARFLMPFAIIIPIIGGLLQSYGVKFGIFPRDLGSAFFDTINVLLFIILIWRCCVYLNKENKAFSSEMKKRIQAEEAARFNEEFLSALIENLPEMVFVKDESLRFVRVNKAAEDVVNISKENLIGKRDEDFFPAEQAILFTRTDREAFRKPSNVIIQEEKIGTGVAARWLHTKKIIVEGSGGARYLLGISQDITERKKMDEQLRQFNKELEQMVIERTRQLQEKEEEKTRLEKTLLQEQLNLQRNLMQANIDGQEKEKREIGMELHDNINQVLTSTKLYLDLAIHDEQLRDKMLGKCKEQIHYAIQEIRNLSKSLVPHGIDTGGLEEGIQEIIEAMKLSAGINCHTQINKSALDQLSPKQQITVYRIIQEQINNVIKHADAGSVFIGLRVVDQKIELRIEDDGNGFDVNNKRSGIGLSNIKSRTELLNGEMKLQSSPGQGCILQIRF